MKLYAQEPKKREVNLIRPWEITALVLFWPFLLLWDEQMIYNQYIEILLSWQHMSNETTNMQFTSMPQRSSTHLHPISNFSEFSFLLKDELRIWDDMIND